MKKFGFTLLMLIMLVGCSSENFGSGLNKDLPKSMVKDVLLNPSMEGKLVNLEGIIVSQCASSGCWFFLKDASGQIFVDLAPQGFSLPPKMGKTVKITGTVAKWQTGMKIIAQGVQIN